MGWPTCPAIKSRIGKKKQKKPQHRTKQTYISAFTPTNSETSFEAIPDIIKNAAYIKYSNSKGHNSIFSIPLVKWDQLGLLP